MKNFLETAAEVAENEPDDEKQGRVRVVLTTGEVIVGRVEAVSDGLVAVMPHGRGEYRPWPGHGNYAVFVRLEHIVYATFCD